MDPKLKIYAALAGVMHDLRELPKTEENQMQHYKYRGIDKLMNLAHVSLDKHRIIVLPCVMNEPIIEIGPVSKSGSQMYRSLVKMQYTFLSTEDGSSVVSGPFIGEGLDTSDKASNKAQTAAYKWCFFQTFCLPTEGAMQDSEKPNVIDNEAGAAEQTQELGDELATEFTKPAQGTEQTKPEETPEQKDERHKDELTAALKLICNNNVKSMKNLLIKWSEFEGDKGERLFIDTLHSPKLKGKWLNKIIGIARVELQEFLDVGLNKAAEDMTSEERQRTMATMEGAVPDAK